MAVTLFDRINRRNFQVATERQATQLMRQLPDQFSRATTAPRPTPRRAPTPRPTVPAATFVGHRTPPPLPRPTPRPVPPPVPRPTPQSGDLRRSQLPPPRPNRFREFLNPGDFLARAGRGAGLARDDLRDLLDRNLSPGFNLYRGFSKRSFSEFLDEYDADPFLHPHPGFSHDPESFSRNFSGDPGIVGSNPNDFRDFTFVRPYRGPYRARGWY